MRNIFFAIIFLLIPVLLVSETEPLYNTSVSSVYLFQYSRGVEASMDNYFVRELAKINYLNPYRTSYGLEYNIEIAITEISEKKLEIISRFTPIKMFGELAYRNFDIASLFVPELYGFTLIINQNSGETINWTSEDLLKGEQVKSILELPESADFKNTSFEIINIRFSYNEKSVARFNRVMNEIHEYLANLELINFSLSKAENIEPENDDALFENHFSIYDLEVFQVYLDTIKFHTDLVVPLDYEEEWQLGKRTLNSNLRRLRTQLTRRLELIDFRLDGEDYHRAAERIIQIQIGYVEEMGRVIHFHEPVYKRFAEFFKDDTDWRQMFLAVARQFSMIDTSILQNKLIAELVRNYIARSDEYYIHEQYNESLLLLTSADVVCRINAEIDCNLEIFNRMAKSKFGIYDSYLSIAQSAMSAGNPDLARRYLGQAADYQKANSGLILVAGAVNDLLEKLAWQYFEEGRSAVRLAKWDIASAYLVAAKEIYNSLNKHYFNEAIEHELSKIEK